MISAFAEPLALALDLTIGIVSDVATSLDGDGDGTEAAAGEAPRAGVGDGMAAPATEFRLGVTIVGKTEPFSIPAANRMKSNDAKMAP